VKRDSNVVVNLSFPGDATASPVIWIATAFVSTRINFSPDVRHQSLNAVPRFALEVISLNRSGEILEEVKSVSQVRSASSIDDHPVEDLRGSAELLRQHNRFNVTTLAAR
jgi:hypothetical protein